MADQLDQLARDLQGLSRAEIEAVTGTAPAVVHLCPLCGGAGSVSDAALAEYVHRLQAVDATRPPAGG